MIKILVVGQTPPPYGGQAVMIEKLLMTKFNKVQFYHVRLLFSMELSESGKVNLYKLFHLFVVITKIIFYRFLYNVRILYYPPSGKSKIPMFRDIIILSIVRPFFSKTIFHFHGNGVSELYNDLPGVARFFYRLAYFKPDIAIRLSTLNPEDGKILKAKQEFIIPNGLQDYFLDFKDIQANSKNINLLYVGLIKESKGILILIESFAELYKKNKDLLLNLVGVFDSIQLEKKVMEFIERNKLPVTLSGVLIGKNKFSVYRNSDIFCFPSFFESEGFPLVLLEAMQFELPIVATYWRGIPDVVQNGENGFLVPIKNSHIFTEKLDLLIRNKDLRKEMGKKGRELFLEKYSIEKHLSEMERVFNSV